MVAVGDPVILERMPGYLVASASETSDSSTFTTTETVVGTITASLISGVSYWVRCGVKLRSTVAGDQIRAQMREDDTSGTMLATDDKLNATTSGSRPNTFPLEGLYTAVATGNKTFVVTGARIAGTGDVSRDVLSSAPQIFSITVAG